MPSPELDIALVGCGRWGANILADLVALGCRVHVVEPDPVRDRLVGAHAVVPSLDHVGAVSGVVVATPISMHAETVRSALVRDVPVFVEKPLTADPGTAAELADAGAGRVFMMDKWRYHPGIRALARVRSDGTIGAVHTVHTIRHSPPISQSDVSCAWVLAPHDIAIIETIAGPITGIRSAHATWSGAALTALRAEVDAGSVRATLDISVVAETTVRAVTAVGTDGTASLEGAYAPEVQVRSADGGVTRSVAAEGELPLRAELRAFVSYLHGGDPPCADVESGLRTVKVVAEILDRAGAVSAAVTG